MGLIARTDVGYLVPLLQGTEVTNITFGFQDLLKILYVGENTQYLQTEGESAGADGKAGIRVLEISPDGQHLAAGDRCGNLQ